MVRRPIPDMVIEFPRNPIAAAGVGPRVDAVRDIPSFPMATFSSGFNQETCLSDGVLLLPPRSRSRNRGPS